METKFVIFAVSLVLLVPFLYYATSMPEVCAVPPDPNFQAKGSDCSRLNNL